MKKIFLVALAAVGLAACATEDTIVTPQGQAIAFGDAFVDNSTKAIIASAGDIQGFQVWGNVKGSNATPVPLYGETGAAVTRDGAALGAAWSCDVTRYWTPSCTFNFAAIANHDGVTVVDGIPTAINYTVANDDTNDLIYGVATATTDSSCVPSGSVNDAKVVAFTMVHLLSRVQLSFQNGVDTPDDAYSYAISNITVSTWDKGIYTIGKPTPWAQDGTGSAELAYAAVDAVSEGATVASATANVVIPGSSVTVSFNYALKLNGTTIYNGVVSGTIPSSVTLEKGHSYNLKAEFTLENKIQFTVSNGENSLAAWTSPATEVTVE